MAMNNEKNTFNPEVKRDHEALKEVGEKHSEKLREDRLERAGEASQENIDEVQHEALNEALSKEKLTERHEKTDRQPSLAERRNNTPISKAESFNVIMKEIHSQMSAPSRTFSKVIHNKTVERVSEVAGSTIARPDAILSGAIAAFLLTLGVYLVAKNLGYPLSGFETIGAFALGWVLGLAFDFVKVMVTGRK